MSKEKPHDVIIIGTGPAGMTAAVYCARKKLETLIIGQQLGGQAALSGAMENYLGFHLITGAQLIEKFHEHLEDFKEVTHRHGVEVTDIKKHKSGFRVTTKDGQHHFGKTVIVASGKIPRKLNVPGEDKYKNLGVTYCATCDAPLFPKKDVAVIGGGNSALDATLQLIKIAKKIYLINITEALGGDAVMREKVEKSKKVEILNNTKTLEILGDKFVTGIKVETEGQEKTLPVSGVFIEIGSIPSVGFIKDLVELNERNEIVIDRRNMTSVPGIFAAGDVTDVLEKQVIVAAGEGAKAAIHASEYLEKQK
ncbi:MAG: NAD(P)/FAD-dependent oxidoreductase [Nitrospinales bacterium]